MQNATKRFEIALAGDDPELAKQSYEAMRDYGFSEDPLLRQRLALATRFPDLGWSGRDLSGLGSLLAVMLALCLIPIIWLVPVHYRGLIRTRAGNFPSLRDWGPINLRHVWLVSCLIILADFILFYILWYPGVESYWKDLYVVPEPTTTNIAYYMLVSSLMMVFIGLFFAPKLRQVAPDHKPMGWARWLGILIIANVVLYLAARFWGEWFADSYIQAGIVDSLSQGVIALYKTWGAWAVIFVLCVAAPIGEEAVFRGVLLQGFSRHISFWAANLIQASMFAALHELAMFPFFLLFGCVAGWMRKRSGKIYLPIIMHAIHNSIPAYLILTAYKQAGL